MKFKQIFLLMLFAGVFGCTDLKETLREDWTPEQFDAYDKANADAGALLNATYNSLRNPFMDQSRFWAAQQHTTDETLGPTRGPDWDDNGIWRVLHNHTWTAEHAFLSATFNELLQSQFRATDLLRFSPTSQQAAEARFLRAFVIFCTADGWGQVPYREPGEDLLQPARVYRGSEALDVVISECQAIINNLPDGPVNRANKDAARVLLMKAFLNKGTFANRQSPTFPAGDMQEVINAADQIINSGKYSLANNYFDNFAPNNDQISTENIWTGENQGGVSSGNVRSRWFCTLHYNQNPSGWNGFATLSDFYNSFEANDGRRRADYDGMTNVSGINAGFLVGQQVDQNGNALQDRRGNPLAFTPQVSLVETGNNLEITGIRVIKYPIDYTGGDNANNDYVFFRYADVLMMKAEALLRSGNAGAALDIVNQIRTKRNATPLASLDADILLAERGREFYWEGWRRQDLIRFGKFLQPFGTTKPASGPERLLFPIPVQALAVNPNLEQNPGY
ncbi:MAG: RagB/SusD family nutrient uptake outer membrane protein [Saprospiraceae bacterium]|nr:RagB/SusD family nutrient uptake outer membrane protein [Saprospiraceae bacterium]